MPYQPDTLFYGSSSIRLWESLYNDFATYKPVNLGFGGSTLAACVWFFDRLMMPLNPKRLVVYAGDNDLSDGRNPEEVFIFFEQLVVKARQRLAICLAILSRSNQAPAAGTWQINLDMPII